MIRVGPNSYDGVHVWVRYQSDFQIYAVTVNRRDDCVVKKAKKTPGGRSNGGTYFTLAEARYSVPFGATQHVASSLATSQPTRQCSRLRSMDALSSGRWTKKWSAERRSQNLVASESAAILVNSISTTSWLLCYDRSVVRRLKRAGKRVPAASLFYRDGSAETEHLNTRFVTFISGV